MMALALPGAMGWNAALAESTVHTVVIEGMKFSPDVLEVQVGDTVIWRNKDIVPHNVTAANHAFHSPTISPEGSWKYTARKKGEYDYLCTLHPTMKAKLILR
ncbi:plastocyanin [Paucimonas lemoignei]|uniref:Plastocyanin n=2 Tax=Paucimonas lemoignei TaxID=29443 RepID=A0A4R3HU86_PAULE|nr:plastocyanin [Paucimonas lemoignei]